MALGRDQKACLAGENRHQGEGRMEELTKLVQNINSVLWGVYCLIPLLSLIHI